VLSAWLCFRLRKRAHLRWERKAATRGPCAPACASIAYFPSRLPFLAESVQGSDKSYSVAQLGACKPQTRAEPTWTACHQDSSSTSRWEDGETFRSLEKHIRSGRCEASNLFDERCVCEPTRIYIRTIIALAPVAGLTESLNVSCPSCFVMTVPHNKPSERSLWTLQPPLRLSSALFINQILRSSLSRKSSNPSHITFPLHDQHLL
jgi:hypothetical protein